MEGEVGTSSWQSMEGIFSLVTLNSELLTQELGETCPHYLSISKWLGNLHIPLILVLTVALLQYVLLSSFYREGE